MEQRYNLSSPLVKKETLEPEHHLVDNILQGKESFK